MIPCLPPPPQPEAISEEALFDGGLLARNLRRFLRRMNEALKDAGDALPDFEIEEIGLSLAVGIDGNVSLAGVAGIGFDRTRSFQFTLKRKVLKP